MIPKIHKYSVIFASAAVSALLFAYTAQLSSAKRIIPPTPAEPTEATPAGPLNQEVPGSVNTKKVERIRENHGDDLLINYYALGKDAAILKHKRDKIAAVYKQTRIFLDSLQNTIATIDQSIVNTEHNIENTKHDISELSKEIKALENVIVQKNADLEGQKLLLSTYLNQLYDNRSLSSLEILLRSDTLADMLDSSQDLEMLEETGRILYENISLLAEELRASQEHKQLLHNSLTTQYAQLTGDLANLEHLKSEKQSILEITKGKEEIYQRLLIEAREEEKRVDVEMEQLKDIINAIQDTAGREKLRLLEERLGAAFSFDSASLSWPVDPEPGITAYFDDPDYESMFDRVHHAIDIRAKQGTTIQAIQDGYVFRAADNGYGYSYIILVHSRDMVSVYGHVSDISVTEGDVVRKGDIIGKTGGTPGSRGAGKLTTGPHLHFEMRNRGVAEDPLLYLPPLP